MEMAASVLNVMPMRGVGLPEGDRSTLLGGDLIFFARPPDGPLEARLGELRAEALSPSDPGSALAIALGITRDLVAADATLRADTARQLACVCFHWAVPPELRASTTVAFTAERWAAEGTLVWSVGVLFCMLYTRGASPVEQELALQWDLAAAAPAGVPVGTAATHPDLYASLCAGCLKGDTGARFSLSELLEELQLLHGNAKPSLADSRFRVAYDDARFFDAATGSLKPFNSEDLQRALRDFV